MLLVRSCRCERDHTGSHTSKQSTLITYPSLGTVTDNSAMRRTIFPPL